MYLTKCGRYIDIFLCQNVRNSKKTKQNNNNKKKKKKKQKKKKTVVGYHVVLATLLVVLLRIVSYVFCVFTGGDWLQLDSSQTKSRLELYSKVNMNGM